MLVLTRRIGEKILIGENADISVSVLAIKGNQIKLGVAAPPHIVIDRQEVWELKNAKKKQAND